MELPNVRQKLIDHNHQEWIPLAEYIAELFADRIEKLVGIKANVLQLGCACGYTLDALWEVGFKNLTGLDRDKISLRAITNPKIKKIYGELSEVINKLGSYDVVLCSQFLYALPPGKEWLFEKIVPKIKKYLVVVEREEENMGLHWNRNYKDIFESFKLKQIFKEINIFPLQFGSLTTTTTRIFKKWK